MTGETEAMTLDTSCSSPFTFTLDALMPNAHNPRAAAKTIKKLLEQRDEARELLAKERASPLLQELQEAKRALEAAVAESHKTNLGLAAELAQARDAAFHATADYRVSVESYEKMIMDLKIDHAKACADAVAKFESYEKQLEEIRAQARVDDVNLLKKRLAAKAEELRLMVIDRDQFKVAALQAVEQSNQLRTQLALLPAEVRAHMRELAQGRG